MQIERRKRVLVVDDEPSNRELLEALLTSFGHDVDMVADGCEALAKLDASHDLVLLDVMMPGIDGFEVARRIRTESSVPNIPICMVTAFWDKEERLRAVAAGVNDFIAKPVDKTELQVRTASLLRAKEAQDAATHYRAELEASNVDLEHFAYVASHDLQEPLRTIRGFIQLLEKNYGDLFDETAREYMSFVIDGAQRMQNLVKALLDYSRITSAKEVCVPTDMGVILAKVEQSIHQSIVDAQATISSEPLPVVEGDPVQLAQLMQNLIANAIKFRRSDIVPSIRVGVTESDKYWTFSVSDNGIGIEKEHFDRIFTMFQRLHTSAEFAGTGIGLSVCKRIVERHGGTICVESEPQKGSTFFFTLPKNRSAAKLLRE